MITATDFEVTIDFTRRVLGMERVEFGDGLRDSFLATRNSTSTMQRRTSRGRPGVFPPDQRFLPSERNAILQVIESPAGL